MKDSYTVYSVPYTDSEGFTFTFDFTFDFDTDFDTEMTSEFSVE
jgi:hypothetical protein